MALYNTGAGREGMTLLLEELARSSDDAQIQRYRRAITSYATRLDDVWD